MSIYSEIYDEIVALTNRPDMEMETRAKMASAIQTYHAKEFWVKDRTLLENAPYSHNSDTGITTIEKGSLPRFRTLPDYQKCDSEYGAIFLSFGPACPDSSGFKKLHDLLDIRSAIGYWEDGLNIYLRSGSLIPPTTLSVVYYQHPVTSPINDFSAWDSWIAREYRELIVTKAVDMLLATINHGDPSGKRAREILELEETLMRMELDD